MAAQERPRDFSALLKSEVDPENPSTVTLKLQRLYHPPHTPLTPETFANGLKQLVYVDFFGRKMFLPNPDNVRAALPPLEFVGNDSEASEKIAIFPTEASGSLELQPTGTEGDQ